MYRVEGGGGREPWNNGLILRIALTGAILVYTKFMANLTNQSCGDLQPAVAYVG